MSRSPRTAVDMIVAASEAGEPYQLCLMDRQLPELDGVGAVKGIRGKGIQLPIIALIAEGFNGYLSKPLEVSDLLRLARRLLQS